MGIFCHSKKYWNKMLPTQKLLTLLMCIINFLPVCHQILYHLSFSYSYNMSTYIQDEIPTIMANFTCITGNCSHLESTSVTTSSEAPFEDEPEAVPYTTIQAILIGMASGLLSLVTIVGMLQKIIRELILLLKKPYSQFCCICTKFCSFSTMYYLQRNLCFNKVCKILPSSLLHSNSINGSFHL